MQAQTAIAPAALAPADDNLFYRIWPQAMIALGLGLTAAWTGLLGYGLVSLIALAFYGAASPPLLSPPNQNT